MDAENDYTEEKRRLGLRISLGREAKGMSQRALSSEIGLDRPTLNKIESGKANPTFQTICRIADGLGMSVWDLIGRG